MNDKQTVLELKWTSPSGGYGVWAPEGKVRPEITLTRHFREKYLNNAKRVVIGPAE